MDEHDEALEAIPWDRFASVERRLDPRWLLAAVLVLVLVGVAAFSFRRSTEPVVAAPAAVPATTSTTTTSTSLPPDEGLWAAPPPIAPSVAPLAARFLSALLLEAGLDVVSIGPTSPMEGDGDGRVVVEALVRGREAGLLRLGMEVEVAGDGTIASWAPVEVDPVRVRPLFDGARPPADVLDGLVRTAAVWGTTAEVLRSGIDDGRWWAELAVALADGSVVPLVVWEDYPG